MDCGCDNKAFRGLNAMHLLLIGALNASTGQLVSMIVPHCDAEVFQIFLDEMATQVPRRGKRVLLALDNASHEMGIS
jgi:hypothetical protein